MRLTVVMDVPEYPTMDEYRMFVAQLPDGATLVSIVEEETTIDVVAEMARGA